MIIFLLILKFVPEIIIEESKKKTHQSKLFSKEIVGYLVLCLWTFIVIFGVQLKIPTLLASLDNGDASLGGMTLSIMNLMGLFAGITFGPLLRKFRYRVFIFGYFGAGVTVLLLALSTNVLLSMISGILFNFIYSFTGPFIVLQLNTLTPREAIVKVNSFFSLIIIGSQFAAPLFWNTVANIFQLSTMQLLLLIAVMLVVTSLIIFLVFNRKDKQR